MQLNELTALSPIDGRYRNKTAALAPYLSEWGLMKYRVEVEVEYFIALVGEPALNLPALEPQTLQDLRSIYTAFSEADAEKIKAFERVTNHDVKAVEYFIKERMTELGCGAIQEFVHFGLTSQDVNNTAIPLSLKRATEEVFIPYLDEVRATLLAQARVAGHSDVGAHTWPASISGHVGQRVGCICGSFGCTADKIEGLGLSGQVWWSHGAV